MTDAYKRLNHEWIEWEDPATHIPYYENTVTGEVSWDRPNIPQAAPPPAPPQPSPQQIQQQQQDAAAAEAARRAAAEQAEAARVAAAAAAERERIRQAEFEAQRLAAIKAEQERQAAEKAAREAERERQEALERAEAAERERQAAIIAERERQAKIAAEEKARFEAERVRKLKQQQEAIEQQKRQLEQQLLLLQQQQAALLEQTTALTQQQQELDQSGLSQQVAEVELQIERRRGESVSFANQIAKRAAAMQGVSAALSAGVPGTSSGPSSGSGTPNQASRSIQQASTIPNQHPGIAPPSSIQRSEVSDAAAAAGPPDAPAFTVPSAPAAPSATPAPAAPAPAASPTHAHAGPAFPMSFAEQLAAKLAAKQDRQPIATPTLQGGGSIQSLLASPPPPAPANGGLTPAVPIAPAAIAAPAAPAAPAVIPAPSASPTPTHQAPAPQRSPPLLSHSLQGGGTPNSSTRVISSVPGQPGYVPPPPRANAAAATTTTTPPTSTPTTPSPSYAQFQPPPQPVASPTAATPVPAVPPPVMIPAVAPPGYVRGSSLSSSPPTIDTYNPVGAGPVHHGSFSGGQAPTTPISSQGYTSVSSTSNTAVRNSTSSNQAAHESTASSGPATAKPAPSASPKAEVRTSPGTPQKVDPNKSTPSSAPIPHHRDESLAEYSFASFSAKNFNPENRADGGLFKKQGSISDLAIFTKQIAKPLIKQLPLPLHKDALQTFKNITSYMGDRRSSKDGHGHATKLLYMGINTPGLRDEIYCQLIKQTTQNPKIESEMRGWELLSMCCSVFPPSQEFHHYLSVHLQQSESTEYKSRQAIADTATYCRQMLPITMRRGNRLLVPSPTEMTAMMSRRPVDVKVELLDETFQVVLSWPQMTVREFYDKLVGLFGFKLPTWQGLPLFGLYQVATDGGVFVMESPLGDETRIMDVVAGWYQGQKKALAKNANSQLHFKLVFKAKYFIHSLLTKEALSDDCLHLYYIQAAADVVSHHLHFPLYEAIKLAGLMMRVADFTGDLKDQIHKFLSVRHINGELGGKTTLAKARASKKPCKELDALVAQVLGAYQPKREMTKIQCKRALLDICMKHPLYGCHTFAVTYAVDARPNDWERKLKKWGDTGPTLQAFTGSGKNALKEPEDVWLGVGEKGVVFIDKLTREVKRHDPLQQIAKYDYTKDTFFYYVKTVEYDGSFESAQQRVQAIKCEQTQAEKIVTLINFYWEIFVAKVDPSQPQQQQQDRTSMNSQSQSQSQSQQQQAKPAPLNVNAQTQPTQIGQGSWLASPTTGPASSPYHTQQTLSSPPSSNGYAPVMSPTHTASNTSPPAHQQYAPPPQPVAVAALGAAAHPQQPQQAYAQQQQQQAYAQQQGYAQQQQQQAYAQQQYAQQQQVRQVTPPQRSPVHAPQASPVHAPSGSPVYGATPAPYGAPSASPSSAARQFAPPPTTHTSHPPQQYGPTTSYYGNNPLNAPPQIQ